MNIVWYIIVAIIYSLAIGLRKILYNKESFDAMKVLKTVIAAIIVGFILSAQGIELTPENVENILSSFGVVAIADIIATWIVKIFKKQEQ